MVVAMQLMRLFAILFCAEPLFRRWQRRQVNPVVGITADLTQTGLR